MRRTNIKKRVTGINISEENFLILKQYSIIMKKSISELFDDILADELIRIKEQLKGLEEFKKLMDKDA